MRFRSLFLFLGYFMLAFMPAISLSQIVEPSPDKNYLLIHSSGNVLGENPEGRAVIQEFSGDQEQFLQFIPDGTGFYWVKIVDQNKYMALNGGWNTYFSADASTDESKYAIERVSNSYIRLKCKANNKYLGTDSANANSNVYSDKDGTDSKHYWYISEEYASAPINTLSYLINPGATFEKSFEGWGVSLCWWANMCGGWSDDKIDEIVDWLVSPSGLNYTIFRYNIGGGDDPENRNCDPHHMGNGKGLRAEMEGFKLYPDAEYDWSRDETQRKIMLKIKEKRPDAIFEAFSNSAPYYMTYSGCSAGNTSASEDNVKPEYYDEFATYLVDVCRFYKETYDIEFKTLAPFNEPVTNYWSANGGQEGCHFSTAAQIDFLKILSPVLDASGLNTIISASDETSVSQSVIDFKAYLNDGTVLDLVNQWNTHTYGATNKDRANVRALATANNKTLWMSEVGSGGTGISGNLNLAQKLINDIRYIRPEAWVDWQYIEEGNDQWCLVKGDFNAQTYERIKNFYVRKQFSHYIPAGSSFVAVPNDQMLAAISPDGDSLVVVALNTSGFMESHQIDLSLFDEFGSEITATRTSETENNTTITDYFIEDSILTLATAKQSVTTLVIPIKITSSIGKEVKTDVPYLILPRSASQVMQPTGDNTEINNFISGETHQLWTFSSSGDGYVIKNLEGEILTDNGGYYPTLTLSESAGQNFKLESVGDGYYKIISSTTGKVLDLEGQNNVSGTKIGLYAYGDTPASSPQQWMFYLPPFSTDSSDFLSTDQELKKPADTIRVVGASGAIVLLQELGFSSWIEIYTITGAKLLAQKVEAYFTRIPLQSGIYIVKSKNRENGNISATKVFVR